VKPNVNSNIELYKDIHSRLTPKSQKLKTAKVPYDIGKYIFGPHSVSQQKAPKTLRISG
jgi:hypothetical protein